MMDVDEAIRLLNEKLDALERDPTVTTFAGGTFRAWVFSVDGILAGAFADASVRLRVKWNQATRGLPMPNSIVDPGGQYSLFKRRFEMQVPDVRATLEAIITELETFGEPVAEDKEAKMQRRPSAIIAHGGESEALNKLANFLDEIGVKPLIVERMPSEGRSVNENVEHYLEEADCAIALATGDDVVDGKLQSRANVQIELGRFQERFPKRTIYLLEEGAAFPTNVSEKVWERFTNDNMEKAILKVVRELGAFGLLGTTVAD